MLEEGEAPAPYAVDAGRGDLAVLRAFLIVKRDFLLRLLENPNLLEHESFTDALCSTAAEVADLLHDLLPILTLRAAPDMVQDSIGE